MHAGSSVVVVSVELSTLHSNAVSLVVVVDGASVVSGLHQGALGLHALGSGVAGGL